MPIYEVIKGGLIKPNSIHEYEVGEKFKRDTPIKDATTLGRVRVLSASGQVEFVNQLNTESSDQIETDQRAGTSEQEPQEEHQSEQEAESEAESNVIEIKFDVENADKEALLSKAKELGIRGAHLFGEKRLREEIGLLLNK